MIIAPGEWYAQVALFNPDNTNISYEFLSILYTYLLFIVNEHLNNIINNFIWRHNKSVTHRILFLHWKVLWLQSTSCWVPDKGNSKLRTSSAPSEVQSTCGPSWLDVSIAPEWLRPHGHPINLWCLGAHPVDSYPGRPYRWSSSPASQSSW